MILARRGFRTEGSITRFLHREGHVRPFADAHVRFPDIRIDLDEAEKYRDILRGNSIKVPYAKLVQGKTMAENQKQGVYTVFADGGEVCSGSAHLVAFVGAALGAMNREIIIQLPSGERVEVVRGDAAKEQPVSMEEIETYLAAQETSAHSD